jgi:hypothetical protein
MKNCVYFTNNGCGIPEHMDDVNFNCMKCRHTRIIAAVGLSQEDIKMINNQKDTTDGN